MSSLSFLRKSRHGSASSGSTDTTTETISCVSDGEDATSSTSSLSSGKETSANWRKKMPFRQRMARHFGHSVIQTLVYALLTGHVTNTTSFRPISPTSATTTCCSRSTMSSHLRMTGSPTTTSPSGRSTSNMRSFLASRKRALSFFDQV